MSDPTDMQFPVVCAYSGSPTNSVFRGENYLEFNMSLNKFLRSFSLLMLVVWLLEGSTEHWVGAGGMVHVHGAKGQQDPCFHLPPQAKAGCDNHAHRTDKSEGMGAVPSSHSVSVTPGTLKVKTGGPGGNDVQCVKGDRETHKELWEPQSTSAHGRRGSLAEEAASVVQFDRWTV